jgi:SAM-dependent methyltransferase
VVQFVGSDPNHTALDAGCGTGNLSIELANRGYEVDAFDVSAPMIHFAKYIAALSARESQLEQARCVVRAAHGVQRFLDDQTVYVRLRSGRADPVSRRLQDAAHETHQILLLRFVRFDDWCNDERRHSRFFALMLRS